MTTTTVDTPIASRPAASLAARNTDILFRGDRYLVRFNRVSDADEVVVVFNPGDEAPHIDKPFWGEDYFIRRGINAIGVTTAANDWYAQPEIEFALESIRHATAGMTLIGYGASMGGFGVLNHAEALGVVRVVAVTPQFSPDLRKTPFETRFTQLYVDPDFPIDRMAHQNRRAEGYIIFDPLMRDDRRHAELIAPHHDLQKVLVPFAGHHPFPLLHQAGLLNDALAAMLRGTLEPAALRRQLRQRRRQSRSYLGRVGLLSLQRAQPDAAITFFDQARAAHGEPSFEIDRVHARLLVEQGNQVRATDILQGWLDDPTQGPAARALLAEGGVAPQARVLTLFESHRYRVRLNRVSDEPFCVVVFDPGGDPSPSWGRTFWGEDFFARRGLNAIGITARLNDYYAQHEIVEVLRTVRAATRGMQLVGYGPSMGGHGVVNHAEALGLIRVAAIAPIFSPRPEETAFDRRFLHLPVDREFPLAQVDRRRSRARGYIMFDPLMREERGHAERIIRHHDLQPVCVPLSGHGPLQMLVETGLLEDIVIAMLRGMLDVGAFRKTFRAHRKRSVTYLVQIGFQLERRGKPRDALGMFDRARALAAPTHFVVASAHARLLAANGRADEVIRVLEPWTSDGEHGAEARQLLHALVPAAPETRLSELQAASPAPHPALPAFGFAAGTRIRTAAGEVAVEDLVEGELIATAEGALLPLRWLGKRRFDARHASAQRPVCIRRDALGDNLPSRDLRLGRDHGLVLDDTMLPAGLLVNGTSLVLGEAGRPMPTLFHVELDADATLFAEDVPVRAVLGVEDRAWFANAASAPAGRPRPAEAVLPADLLRRVGERLAAQAERVYSLEQATAGGV